jgi:hypothetical protein
MAILKHKCYLTAALYQLSIRTAIHYSCADELVGQFERRYLWSALCAQ